MSDLIDKITSTADCVVPGTFRGQGPGGSRGPVDFYVKGADVVVGKGKEFVTILKDGALNNTSVRRALGLE